MDVLERDRANNRVALLAKAAEDGDYAEVNTLALFAIADALEQLAQAIAAQGSIMQGSAEPTKG